MEDKSKNYEARVVVVLMLMYGIIGVFRVGITYLFPVLAKEFHLVPWQLAALVSGTSVTWALSSWFGAILSDKFGKRKVLLWFFSIASVISAGMGVAWSFLSMFVVRDLIGLADGAGWSIGNAIVAAESAPRRRGINHALFTAGYTLVGAGLGAYVITHLATAFGWRSVFPIFAILSLILAVIMSKVIHEPTIQGDKQNIRRNVSYYLKYLTNGKVIKLVVLSIFVLAFLQTSITFNSMFLTKKGLNLNATGDIEAIWGLLGVAGQIILPLLSDRIGRRPIVLVSSILAGLGVLGNICIATSFNGLALFYGISGFFGFGIIPICIAAIVVESVAPHERAVALGITNFFGVIVGTAVLPLLAGVIAGSHGLNSAMLFPAISVFLVFVTMLFIPETAPVVLASKGKSVKL